jgi:pSer/pThr/pTyr-binding forkhead associated (FHA) protein
VGKQIYPMRLTLRLVDRSRVLSTQLADRLVIGRGGGSRKPEIDLSNFDGLRCGISRWHAVFIYDENNLFVEDLNSTNGTRINGYQIDTGRAYRLRNGDELELGSLRMIVNMVRPPN